LIERSPRAHKERFFRRLRKAEQLYDELKAKKTKQLLKQDKARIQGQRKEAKLSLKELQKTWKTEIYKKLKQNAIENGWYWPDLKDAAG